MVCIYYPRLHLGLHAFAAFAAISLSKCYLNTIQFLKCFFLLSQPCTSEENKGNLISRYAKDGQGNGIYCEKFTYDAYGNPIEEHFYGNLSGENATPLVFDNQGVLQDNGSEYLQVSRTYSSDGMNLLLSEKTDQVETRYQYQPDTNIMTAKYLLVDGKIRERNFYHYDSKGILRYAQ